MNLDRLDTLKDKLIHGKDFAAIMTYFFDHFGDDPEFLKLGRREESKQFEQMVASIGEQVLHKKARLDHFVATRIDEKGFIHGGGLLDGRVLSVVFFEDINKGLLAIHGGGIQTHFLRFTGTVLPKGFPLNN